MSAMLYTAQIDPPWDLAAWRSAARAGLCAQIAPERIAWSGDAQQGLLAGDDLRAAPPTRRAPTVPKALFDLASMVLCHRDPQRHALLYRIAWRIAEGERHLLGRATDPDTHQASQWAKSVGRDTHKMKAFVRFKAVPGEDNAFIAWFEPEHFIVDRVAPFFARRFAGMRWAILTPDRSVAWNGEGLSFGEGAKRSDAPVDDAREDLWRTYYASIFNPARLNPRMMRQEMPKKYWKHLPETHLLPELIKTAGRRVQAMAEREPEPTRRKVPVRQSSDRQK
jgi:uracil-DNA glycosylase